MIHTRCNIQGLYKQTNKQTNGGIKNIISYHLKIIKICVFSSKFDGVAQKISLPHPWPFETSQGRGRLIFWATTSKFGEKTHLLMIFKWYEIMFLIPPLVSDLKKSGWAAPYIPIACTWVRPSDKIILWITIAECLILEINKKLH